MRFEKGRYRATLAFICGLAFASCGSDGENPDRQPPPQRMETTPPASRSTEFPPPISGGTLLILADGHTAVAADSDRDRVWIVDLDAQSMRAEIVLNPADEPGRLVEDRAGRVHVALRGGGALATLDVAARRIIERRPVCGAPRGVAYDARKDVVHVACATGELVTLPAGTGDPIRTLDIEPDLRDVIVAKDRLFVSFFRSARLIEISDDGEIASQLAPPRKFDHRPGVAWRTIVTPSGALAMLHQREKLSPISVDPGGYGSRSSPTSTLHSAVTLLQPATMPIATGALSGVTLVVDLAVSPDGKKVALAVAGGPPTQPGLLITAMSELEQPAELITNFEPGFQLRAAVVAVAYDGKGRLVAQTREPAALYLSTQSMPIPLPGSSRHDTGHAMFHRGTAVNLACASCHPEGGDDGHVWLIDTIGARRTQSLRGGLLATAPFHWNGDAADLGSLMHQVFTIRMSGPQISEQESNAMARWLDAQPSHTGLPVRDEAAVQRGRALFQDARVGCATCHHGPKLTNNQTVDVGTGGPFQVPGLLGLATRAPYLHNGCAPSLNDRFGSCGGGDLHGKTSPLTSEQRQDLIAYLQSL